MVLCIKGAAQGTTNRVQLALPVLQFVLLRVVVRQAGIPVGS